MHTTPMHVFHIDHGAQMVDFAGWDMPLRYSSVTAEHEQVRRSGGMFDVSHMGRVRVRGRDATRLLDRLCTRAIATMKPGQCRYTLVCNERGGVRDDVIVMKHADDDYLVVVNASNREKLLAHFEAVRAQSDLKATITDTTMKTAMVAIQGPAVMDFISRFSSEIPTLKRYRFLTKDLMIAKVIVARTGYTGEDGVEVIMPANMVGMAMKMLMKELDPDDPDAIIRPAGLAARDTLRLEAGMPLYGHELGEDICALTSGMDFAITLDKASDAPGDAFVGQSALSAVRDAGGPAQQLVGIALQGRRTPRQGMAVTINDASAGTVTSGCLSPTLGMPIAMALVDAASSEPGTPVQIDTGRGAVLDGTIVPLPFYKRQG